uniref:AMDV2_7 n=1 Tax=uncultured virus TaxID=340016 RepID=B3GAK6_9VIRU|nr:AMDV2_7 [uncultured virus]
MEFKDIISYAILMIISVVIFAALIPSVFSSLSVVVTNSTYVKDFPSTITLLIILPLIVVAIFVIFLIGLFKKN